MRWRAIRAMVVLGLGFLAWWIELATLQGRYWPGPGEPCAAEQFRQFLDRSGIRARLPRQGTVGYRDEAWPPGPQRDVFWTMFQYWLAPVLLDRNYNHDTTVVVKPGGIHIERRRVRP